MNADPISRLIAERSQYSGNNSGASRSNGSHTGSDSEYTGSDDSCTSEAESGKYIFHDKAEENSDNQY
jgi:hypothetical protein